MNNKILFVTGFAVLILGMTLVLHNWDALTIVFQGLLPPIIAVAGLVLMFAATIKKD